MALIDKASLLMVPSTYEDGTLYNVLPSGNKAPDETGNHNGYDQTRADFTFSRGANLAATRVNAAGLIEKGRENLLLQSNSFDVSANWVNNSSTESSGFEGYDGTSDAWKLTATATSGAFIRQIISFSNLKTFSVYAKAGTSSHLLMLTEGGGNTWFDLVSGIIETDAAVLSNMESVGNGWYRCSVTWNSSITGVRLYVCDADGTSSVANGGFIYLQDAQLESGLVATDYIETTTTTAKAGVLENMPRIDYSSGAGALKLEPLRSNLITHSEYFDGWTKVDTTLTHNYGISPEGVRNSTRVQFADDTAYMYIAPAGTSTGTYASSIYIKGTVGETIKFGKGGNIAAGAMHTLNGDWQRIEHITTDVGLSVHISTYGGSTARDIEIYGCQLEAGNYKSSYIPTMGTAASRAADSCENATASTNIFGASKGAFYIEGYVNTFDTNGIIPFTAGTGTSALMYVWIRTNGTLYVEWYESGILQAQLNTTSGAVNVGDSFKIAAAYQNNDFVAYLNGTLIETDTNGTAPNPTSLKLGQYTSGAYKGGALSKVYVFNERLTNTELATLTA